MLPPADTAATIYVALFLPGDRAEQIAATTDGLDFAWFLRVVIETSPQPRDADIDGTIHAVEINAAPAPQQFVAAQDMAGGLYQNHEQGVVGRLQINFAAFPA